MLLLIILAVLYLKFMVFRHAMNRFYGDICFYISLAGTSLALLFFLGLSSGVCIPLLLIMLLA